VAPPAARATPPRPDATPDAPDWPREPSCRRRRRPRRSGPPRTAAAPPEMSARAAAQGEPGTRRRQRWLRRPRRDRCRWRRLRRAAGRRRRGRWRCRDQRCRDRERQRGEHDRHGVVDGRWLTTESCVNWRTERRADADDDGEHQHLDAEEMTLPSTRSAMKAVLPNRPNGIRTKPASVVSLNSISVTKSWTARMKKASSTSAQAKSRQAIWMKFSKKAIQPIRLEMDSSSGLAGIETGLRDPAGAHEILDGKPGARRLKAEAGEALEDDAREVVPVADDVGEDADEQRLLHQRAMMSSSAPQLQNRRPA
jgi:hypothetical protein